MIKKLYLVSVVILLNPIVTFASVINYYPDFKIDVCKTNITGSGVVKNVAISDTTDNDSGVYIQIFGKFSSVNENQEKYGGKLYKSQRTDYAYQHIVNVALLSQTLKLKVKVCHWSSNILAIELDE